MTGILKSAAGYALVVLALHTALKKEAPSPVSSFSVASAMNVLPAASATSAEPSDGSPAIDLHHLVRGAWILQSATSAKAADTNYDGHATTDLLDELPSCCKDDVLRFYDNGEAVFTRYQICNLGEQPYETFNWSIDQNRTIILTTGSITAPMTILSLNADKMVVQMPFDLEGPNLNVTVTYVRPATSAEKAIAGN